MEILLFFICVFYTFDKTGIETDQLYIRDIDKKFIKIRQIDQNLQTELMCLEGKSGDCLIIRICPQKY